MSEHITGGKEPKEDSPNNGGLDNILQRFGEEKNKIIDCGVGWYATLNALDKKLSTLYPYYEIISIKKYQGKLQYNWTIPYDFHLDYFEEDEENFETIYSIMSDVVKHTENKTLTICEKCGGRKALNNRSNLNETLCTKCAI